MTVQVMCPNCNTRLTISNVPPGHQARCGSCNAIFLVPGASPMEPPSPSGPAPAQEQSPDSQTLVCGACMGRFPLASLPPGGKIKCGRCGNIIAVPSPASATSVVLQSIAGPPRQAPPPPPAAPPPAPAPVPKVSREQTSRLSRISRLGGGKGTSKQKKSPGKGTGGRGVKKFRT